ncbi:hypothetical protein [Mycobacterium sp. NBC_00419]|uniref:hypothetical protein n=1 Tax=Mycobacterium sp. NBC_00419 TaxID=2975989 RepID=UPI003FA5A308
MALAFRTAGMDTHLERYTLLAILGTMAIMIVQSRRAFSVSSYVHIRKNHPVGEHWLPTLVAPLMGGLGMLYVVYLLWERKDAAAGTASGSLPVRSRRRGSDLPQDPRPTAIHLDGPYHIRGQHDSRLVAIARGTRT